MMQPRARHALFVLVAIVVGLAIGGLLYHQKQRALVDAQTARTLLRVLALRGVFTPAFRQRLEAQKHIHLDLTEAADPEGLWDLFDAPAKTPFDLVTLMSYQIPTAVQMARVLPLGSGRLESSRISGDFREKPGAQSREHALPILWGVSGILYRPDKLETPPLSWRAVFASEDLNPDDGPKNGRAKIGLLHFPLHIGSWSAEMTNDPPRDEITSIGADAAATKKEMEQTRRLLQPVLRGSDLSPTALHSGEFLEDPGSAARLSVIEMSAAEAANLTAVQKDIWKFVLPETASPFWILSIAITKETKLEKEGYAFMETLLEPDLGLQLARTSGQASVLTALDSSDLASSAKASYLRQIPLTRIQLPKLADFQNARAVHEALDERRAARNAEAH